MIRCNVLIDKTWASDLPLCVLVIHKTFGKTAINLTFVIVEKPNYEQIEMRIDMHFSITPTSAFIFGGKR